MSTDLDELRSRLDFVATRMRSGLEASLDGLVDLNDRIEAVDRRLTAALSEVESQLGRLSRLAAYVDLEKGAEPDAGVAEKIAANYVRFMETLLGPDLPEGVLPSAAVPTK